MQESVTRLIIPKFGPPAEVVERVEEPARPPGAGEIRAEMRLAPINPADLNLIEGRYGIRPALPATAGIEGTGVVVELGPGVAGPPVGTRVLAPAGAGSWQTSIVAPADAFIPLPETLGDEQAATLRVNPATAWLMLSEFVELAPGDWVIQNAANSAVGRHVIQIARHRGLRTINVVRRAELLEELRAEGADVVLEDSDTLRDRVREATGDAPPRLGLNAVGGDSASRIASCLAAGGTLVTYGAMSKKALTLPNALLIFRDLRARGFWVTRWLERADLAARAELYGRLAALVAQGVLRAPVEAVYPLARFREALEHAGRERRSGKILIDLRDPA